MRRRSRCEEYAHNYAMEMSKRFQKLELYWELILVFVCSKEGRGIRGKRVWKPLLRM